MECSQGIILHLCCCKSCNAFRTVADKFGFGVIDVDTKVDLNSPHTVRYLLCLAARGMVKRVLSGLPCRTRSMLRNRPLGPPVVRAMDGDKRWGLCGAPIPDQLKMFEDDCLFLRTLLLMRVADQGLKLKFPDCPLLHGLLENPRGPMATVGDKAGNLPTIWCTPEWVATEKALKLTQYHTKVKPTTIAVHARYWPVWVRSVERNVHAPVADPSREDSSTWSEGQQASSKR